VEGIIDGCERDRHAGFRGFRVQFLDRQVPITLCKQQIRQRDALPRRSKAAMAQSNLDVRHGIRHMCFGSNRFVTRDLI
jgi:hypothetical protein